MPALLVCAADSSALQIDRYVAAAERRGLSPVVVSRGAVAPEAVVDGVVAVRRADAPRAAALAHAHGVRWHPPAAVQASVNRLHLLGRLTAAGIPVPRFASVEVRSGEGLERLAGMPGPWRVTAVPRAWAEMPPDTHSTDVPAEPYILEDVSALEASIDHLRGDGDDVVVVEPLLATPGWLVVALVDDGALRVVGVADVDDVAPGQEARAQVPSALPRDAQAHLGGLVALACASLGLSQGPVVALAGAVEGRACLVDVRAGSLDAPVSEVLQIVGPSLEPVPLEDLVVRHAVGDALDGYALDSRPRTVRFET